MKVIDYSIDIAASHDVTLMAAPTIVAAPAMLTMLTMQPAQDP